jgi:osmoprotectant transport system ATP-binding protein
MARKVALLVFFAPQGTMQRTDERGNSDTIVSSTRVSKAAEFDGVSLQRGAVLALDDVTLALPLGQTTAVLGASGSGKSTLVQMIIGLLRPDTGTVRTLGEPIDFANPRPLRKRIGYAIQDVSLFPHLDVRANILLPATLSGWSEAEKSARLNELLRLMHLARDVLYRYPHELSGGQQQRAGLCRAMMLRPELLLLDEPFSGLDTMTRKSIHEQFLDMQQQAPVSTVLVTHDPQEAINLSHGLVVMKSGRVQQYGAVAEVIANPANEYVRDLCTALESLPVSTS